jgi:hypothetical protein
MFRHLLIVPEGRSKSSRNGSHKLWERFRWQKRKAFYFFLLLCISSFSTPISFESNPQESLPKLSKHVHAHSSLKDVTSKTIYVKKDATGGNTGVSWSDAKNNLQEGLDIASAGDEIWVAQGIYTPTLQTTSDARSATFSLKQGVTLYGGFFGNEIAVHDRDWHANRTILSGDILSDDVGFTENRDDNSYHVVTAWNVDQNTRLDGFIVSGGHADKPYSPSSFPSDAREWINLDLTRQDGFVARENQVNACNPNDSFHSGGGLYTCDSSSVLVNLIFTGNYAIQGGGQYAMESNILMVDCAWIGNYAEFGGGVFINSTPMTITNGIIDGNEAGSLAGGLYHLGGDSLISNTTFNNNYDNFHAKSILNTSNSHLEIWNSIIWGESGTDIITNTLGSSVTLSYSLLRGGCSGIVGLTCNVFLDEDPLFIDADGEDNVIGSLDDDLRLSNNSHAIDHGDNSAVYPDTVDLDDDGDYMEPLPIDWSGEPRFIDAFMEDNGSGLPPLVDMGALETFNFLFLPIARRAES